MKTTLIGLLLVGLMSCGLPTDSKKNSLFQLNSPYDSSIKKAGPVDFANSLLIYEDSIIVNTHSIHQKLPFKELSEFIKQHKSELTKSRLNLITTQSASYQTITNTLNLMSIYTIRDYTLLQQ